MDLPLKIIYSTDLTNPFLFFFLSVILGKQYLKFCLLDESYFPVDKWETAKENSLSSCSRNTLKEEERKWSGFNCKSVFCQSIVRKFPGHDELFFKPVLDIIVTHLLCFYWKFRKLLFFLCLSIEQRARSIKNTEVKPRSIPTNIYH